MASIDIDNMYTNFPIQDTLIILEKNLIDTGILDKKKMKDLINLLKIVLEQNYFVFDNKYYLQEDGLAMLSSLLADIYLNQFEN